MVQVRRERRKKIPYVKPSPYGSYANRKSFFRLERTTITRNGESPSVTETTTNWLASGTNFRNGVSLPNWRAIIKSGGDATTSFDAYRQSVSAEVGYAWNESWNSLGKFQRNLYESHGYPYLMEGWSDLSPMWIPSDMEVEANDAALRFLYKRLREVRTKMQGGVFLGELRETIRMIKSPFKGLRDKTASYLHNLRSRRSAVERLWPPRKRAKKLADVLSETWLEYRFGVLPLCSDLDDAMTAYHHLILREMRNRVSATGRSERVTIQPPVDGSFGQVLTRQEKRKTYRVSVRYKAGLLWKVDRDMSNGDWRRESLGLTIREFVPTAWEILPWSFLVDYFVNVGEILEASVTDTSNVHYIVKTVRKETEVSLVCNVDNGRMQQLAGQLYISSGGSAGSAKQVYSTVARRKLLTIPMPRLQVGIPSSPIQWANMAALATLKRGLVPFFK